MLPGPSVSVATLLLNVLRKGIIGAGQVQKQAIVFLHRATLSRCASARMGVMSNHTKYRKLTLSVLGLPLFLCNFAKKHLGVGSLVSELSRACNLGEVTDHMTLQL